MTSVGGPRELEMQPQGQLAVLPVCLWWDSCFPCIVLTCGWCAGWLGQNPISLGTVYSEVCRSLFLWFPRRSRERRWWWWRSCQGILLLCSGHLISLRCPLMSLFARKQWVKSPSWPWHWASNSLPLLLAFCFPGSLLPSCTPRPGLPLPEEGTPVSSDVGTP